LENALFVADPHYHDGIPCTTHRMCMAHESHPCEGCGKQWPVKYVTMPESKHDQDPPFMRGTSGCQARED
jgi:hypothetical protein